MAYLEMSIAAMMGDLNSAISTSLVTLPWSLPAVIEHVSDIFISSTDSDPHRYEKQKTNGGHDGQPGMIVCTEGM